MSTLPEDKSIGCGWKWLKWPWVTPYDAACERHDINTSEGSFAEKNGIPGSRVDSNFHEMIDTINQGLPRPGMVSRFIGATFKGIVTVFGRFFTGGKYYND